ncbi:FtsK/SpoIIIE domain-containing protein [Propionicimonas sp.]|uniref:FtsK/SpoIIIE domain-containing protein n=1 Tax=Propionicimonas sp. TaxID=1955623 RepID=UPI0039E43BC9
MRLKLELRQSDGSYRPVAVTTEATATVADLAAAIRAGETQLPAPHDSGLTVQVLGDTAPGAGVLPPRSFVAEAGLASGQQIRVVPWTDAAGVPHAAAVAELRVVRGPDAGRTFPLYPGPNVVGRQSGCDVMLSDPLVSRRHARVNVADQVEVIDVGSANGVLVGEDAVETAVLGPRDIARVGETEFTVRLTTPDGAGRAGPVADFNRSPLVRIRYEGRTFAAPKPPGRANPGRFPLIAMAAPLLMGAVLYAFTQNLLSIVFIALSPLIALGSYVDRRWTDGRSRKAARARFGDDLATLSAELDDAARTEQAARCAEVPALEAVLASARRRTPDLWYRRPETDDFLALTLGYGRTESRNQFVLPDRGDASAEDWAALEDLRARAEVVDDVPILARLRECGNLGVAGTADWLAPVARTLVAQLACLHSPAELVLAAIAGPERAARWEWLVWLPHVGSAHSPLHGSHLASAPGAVQALVTGLEELVAARREAKGRVPAVVLLVEDDAPVERGRLVSLAEDGPAVGVHLLWLADRHEQLPAACHAYLVNDDVAKTTSAGFVRQERTVSIGRVEPLSADLAGELARLLAPVLDAGAPVLDQSSIPRTVSFLGMAGGGLATDARATVERWTENGSVGAGPARGTTNLRALVGHGSMGELALDLRAQGPHALVGGTSGAGKSEFLQTWVLGMAAGHSPRRVTFLFVDYKGGSAFADCVNLPHCVGLVTDLSPHLVRRALTSLRAELRYREQLLNRKNAKDLAALERTGDPDCPPSLVIVVDEFAALVSEVPEFVDGVVDVAQRGRSLGLHLILATQRPAGVIRGNLRANTALRIALRMADEADSVDVIDSPLAAEFDPRIPGRAAVRTGPGRISLFQSGYVGGWTSAEPEPARIEIETMVFGAGIPWEIPASPHAVDAAEDGPTDIARVVARIGEAARLCALPAPRRPWLPELGTAYRLEDLLSAAAATGARNGFPLLLGVADDPQHQAQHPVAWNPETEGNLAVFGVSGSGKSTLLRSVAFSAAFRTRAEPTHVYGLDFSTAGLSMLESLPTVGGIIDGADRERTDRLLRRLVETLEERSARFAAARAGSLTEYRARPGSGDEPRILVLLDGFAAFRDEYETALASSPVYARFGRLLTEGRGVGIHLAIAAERPNALPPVVGASVQRRLVLRQADENAYAGLNVPKDVLTSAPAGRGVFSGEANEVQVAVPGGSATPADQSATIDRLGEWLSGQDVPRAPQVGRLAALLRASELPASVAGMPVLGLGEADLAPVGFPAQGAFLIAGLPGSGRTTALRAVVHALHRWRPGLPLYYVGPRRSGVHSEPIWTGTATELEAISELAAALKPLAAIPADGEVEPGLVLVLEGIGEFVGTPAEAVLTDLVKAGRRNGHLVVAEQDTSAWGSGWPLISEVRNSRHGLVMQPDSADGDILFRMALPRVRRSDYPPGRGVYVRAGRQWTVQVPLPDEEAAAGVVRGDRDHRMHRA